MRFGALYWQILAPPLADRDKHRTDDRQHSFSEIDNFVPLLRSALECDDKGLNKATQEKGVDLLASLFETVCSMMLRIYSMREHNQARSESRSASAAFSGPSTE
jgi:hypothetical protein